MESGSERVGLFTNTNEVIIFYFALITFIIIIFVYIWRKMTEVIPDIESFTLEELSRFKKYQNYKMKTYISIKGRVFDVSEHEMFQPKGKFNFFVNNLGKYYKLAGHEIGISLAKGTLDDKYIDSIDCSLLNSTEKKLLKQVYLNFCNDYDLIGHLKEWVDKYGLEDPLPLQKEKKKRVLGVDTRKSVKLNESDKEIKEEKEEKKDEQKKQKEFNIEDGDDEKEKKDSTLKNRKKKNLGK